MTQATDWQGGVGRAWSQEWQRTDLSFSGLTPALLEAIGREPGTRVLDLGCGAGELTLALAQRRAGAQILGIDLSADLVAVARQRAQARDGQELTGLRFAQADATLWAEPDFVPDLLVSRHGVMFFDDPKAAFSHLAHVSAPGARMVFSCFRSPAQNIWASALAGLLPPSGAPGNPRAPGPFAFADPDHVRQSLAGWDNVHLSPQDFTYIAGRGPDAPEQAMALFRRIGPVASAMRQAAPEARPAIEAALRALIAAHHSQGEVGFAAAAWIVTATKAADDHGKR
jgi:SAM-dependent methyltransferase